MNPLPTPEKHSDSPAVKGRHLTVIEGQGKKGHGAGDVIGSIRVAEIDDPPGAFAVFEGLVLGPSGSSGDFWTWPFWTFYDLWYFEREILDAPATRVNLDDLENVG